MTTTIKNKSLERALNAAGIYGVTLVKCDGYFYITSDTNERLAYALDKCDESRVYIFAFSHQSVNAWVEDIRRAVNAAALVPDAEPVPDVITIKLHF